MSYPCIYNEEGTCKLHSTVYEHSWCVEGPCDDQTLSNGDRIRSMTDEELAKEIPCPYMRDMFEECKFGWHEKKQTCEECVLEWIKQPYEVE